MVALLVKSHDCTIRFDIISDARCPMGNTAATNVKRADFKTMSKMVSMSLTGKAIKL